MKSRNHLPLFQFAFGVMLMAVLLGWFVFILELVQRDAEVAEARVREAEERYLQIRAEKFEMGEVQMPVTEGFVKHGAQSGSYSGVWNREPLERNPIVEVKAWPEGLELTSSDDLLKHQDELKWGEAVDGRDRLGQRVLKIAREEGDDFKAMEVLREGVWHYDPIDPGAPGSEFVGSLMSPGFRLLLIKELEKRLPSPELERLKLAERIRAVEGKVWELSGEYEIVRNVGGNADFFYTLEQLESVFGEDVFLSAQRPEGRASVRVSGLERWPFLSVTEGYLIDAVAVKESEKAVYLIGMGTLISTIGLVGGAIWIGRRHLRQARARTDLAASVAHELRTPLAGQRVVLESMLEKEKFDENYLRMALRENERLGDLSEEFLTFSRLERGVLELQLEPLVLRDVVGPAVTDFSAQRENVDVTFKGKGELVAMADGAAVSTIVRNLLENAWKYSEGTSRIEVALIEEGDEVGFSVEDEGIGLSAKEQKRIFRQFYRVEKQLSRSQDGLGIGLSIVKRLVDAMDGRITVKSEKGKGSTFTVFLKRGGEA